MFILRKSWTNRSRIHLARCSYGKRSEHRSIEFPFKTNRTRVAFRIIAFNNIREYILLLYYNIVTRSATCSRRGLRRARWNVVYDS